MSLTKQDLTDIRTVVLDALEAVVEPRFDALEGRMDNVEGGLDKVEGGLQGLEREQATTNQRLSSLEQKVDNLDGRLEALENDIKALYEMTPPSARQTHVASPSYKKLSQQDKLVVLNQELLALAKAAGVSLPNR
jgi:predicted nuclease with TOPRIM domain